MKYAYQVFSYFSSHHIQENYVRATITYRLPTLLVLHSCSCTHRIPQPKTQHAKFCCSCLSALSRNFLQFVWLKYYERSITSVVRRAASPPQDEWRPPREGTPEVKKCDICAKNIMPENKINKMRLNVSRTSKRRVSG